MNDELNKHYPNELHKANTIDWDRLAGEMGTHSGHYLLPSDTEDGDPRLDKLALCQDVARYCRDGGKVDVSRVIVDG